MEPVHFKKAVETPAVLGMLLNTDNEGTHMPIWSLKFDKILLGLDFKGCDC